MSEVEQLQHRIAEIDKQINEILVTKRLPPLKPPKPFPLGTWILVLAVGAYYFFGDLLPFVGSYYGELSRYAMYAAGVLLLLALLRSLMWLFSGKPKTPPEYIEAHQKVKELQEQRRLLEKELRDARRREAAS